MIKSITTHPLLSDNDNKLHGLNRKSKVYRELLDVNQTDAQKCREKRNVDMERDNCVLYWMFPFWGEREEKKQKSDFFCWRMFWQVESSASRSDATLALAQFQAPMSHISSPSTIQVPNLNEIFQCELQFLLTSKSGLK